MPPRKRLGQLLTELKMIDEHQLQSALGHQKQWGGKLGAILVQKGFCREEQVVTALSQHLNMPAVRLADVKIDPRAVKMVSRAVAERLHVFAYEVSGSGRSEVITIAMSDPTDLSAVDQLAFHTGKRIKPMLAGDTEVVAAIQKHYAPEKPAEAPQPSVPAGLRPFVDGAKAPGAAARATPAAPMHAVAATAASAAATRPSQPSIRPVQPAPMPPPPAPSLTPTPPPEPVEPLALEGGDLPADAPMDGLEPIAAYSQGETSLDGADGIPPQGADAASSDEPVPLEDPAALQGWAEGSPDGIPLEQSDGGGGAQAAAPVATPVTPWGEPRVSLRATQQATDELPIDAILGTADVLEHAEETPAAADAPDAWSDISDPLAAQPDPSAAAEAMDDGTPPDAAGGGEAIPQEQASPSDGGPEWESAAAAIEVAANESERAQPMEDAGGAADASESTHAQADEAVDVADAEEDVASFAADADAAHAEGAEEAEAARAIPEEASFLESPEDSPAPLDEVSIDSAGWAEESGDPGASADAAEPAFSMSSPAEEPPGAGDAEASFDVDTQEGAVPDAYGDDHEISATRRHGWLLRHREQSAGGSNQAQQEEMSDEQDSGAGESFEVQQAQEQHEGYEQQEGYDLQEDQSQPGEGEESIELAADEGWTGQPEDAQQGSWFGDALSSTTPLSPADLGTLAALGLDPADGAAAQRMLACLVRVLNRRQAIDLDELAAEIRESQLAADAAAQTQAEDQPGGGEGESSSDDPANVQD